MSLKSSHGAVCLNVCRLLLLPSKRFFKLSDFEQNVSYADEKIWERQQSMATARIVAASAIRSMVATLPQTQCARCLLCVCSAYLTDIIPLQAIVWTVKAEKSFAPRSECIVSDPATDFLLELSVIRPVLRVNFSLVLQITHWR